MAVALAVRLAGWPCEAWVAGAHACLQAGAGPGAVAGAVEQRACGAVVLLLAGAAPGAGGALQAGHVAEALQARVEAGAELLQSLPSAGTTGMWLSHCMVAEASQRAEKEPTDALVGSNTQAVELMTSGCDSVTV